MGGRHQPLVAVGLKIRTSRRETCTFLYRNDVTTAGRVLGPRPIALCTLVPPHGYKLLALPNHTHHPLGHASNQLTLLFSGL